MNYCHGVDSLKRRKQERFRLRTRHEAIRRRQQQVRQAFSGRRLPCPRISGLALLVVWVASLLSVFGGRASGWEDCVMSPDDEWKKADKLIPALRMRYDFERRYTCTNLKASFLAASYFFDSPCMSQKFFYVSEIKSCLKGRRVIFLGDSLSNQQGDSLLGMLGWHPSWMKKGAPGNAKMEVDSDGRNYFTLTECWHPAENSISQVERCYDYYSRDFAHHFAKATHNSGGQHNNNPQIEVDKARGHGTRQRRALAGEGDGGSGETLGQRRAAAEADDDGFSVHMRMMSFPRGADWFEKAMRDYNETRPSDVVVVNFGGHYHDVPEDDVRFKKDVAPILDSMARLGDKATVVWREIAPTHFPATNGSFDSWDSLSNDEKKKQLCCVGTPPEVYDRNLWVENYLRDNGLTDRVKLLRIYSMSVPRGAAHHTCNLAPPSTKDQKGADHHSCPDHGMDCRHWSEPGVVEEWNRLLLSHVCDAAG